MANQPLCSVVIASYQRKHLLERSLMCYEKQDFDNSRFELIVVDDHSTDRTRELVLDWSKTTGIRGSVLTISPKPSQWVDCAWVLNNGIRLSTGKHILLTHPEIMVGRTSVKDCVNKLEEFENNRGTFNQTSIALYACCKCYYLSPDDQRAIDSCPWVNEGAIAVRKIPQFYEQEDSPEWRGHIDFSHRATDMVATPGARIPHWQSWIFGGHSREMWKRLGGMLPTTVWGACDVGWMHRRQMLGIPNYTCPNEGAIVSHQNHDSPNDVLTPRVEQVWKDELAKMELGDPNKLIYPYINEIGW